MKTSKTLIAGLAHVKVGLVALVFWGGMAFAQGQSQNQDQRQGQDFSFVFMTDVHIRDDAFTLTNYRNAIRQINDLQPDFVLSGGDQVFDVMRGDVDKSRKLFDLFVAESKAIKAPLYTTMGNHELFGIYKESPTDSTHRYYKYGMYQEYFGDPYYSFDHKGWHFIVLNNLDAGGYKFFAGFDEAQLRWLETDLARVGKDHPVVMMMHIPLVSVQNQYNLPAEGPSIGPHIIGKNKVMELIKTHNVRLVLQGHHHFWEDILVLGRTRFIIGGAIAGRPSWRGTENGPRSFLQFSIQNGDISYRNIAYENK